MVAFAAGLPALAWILRKRGQPGDPIPRGEPVRRPGGDLLAAGLAAVYIASQVAVLLALVLYLALVLGRLPDPRWFPVEVLLIVDLLAKLLSLLGFMAWLTIRKERGGLLHPGIPAGRALAGGALAGLAFLPFLFGTGLLQDWLYREWGRKFETQELVQQAVQGPAASFAAVAFFAVLVAPPFEEFLFRGLLHSGLRARWGAVPASLASAALFAAFHLNVDVLPGLLLLGLGLAWLRERTGGLMAPIAAHACYNAFQMAGVWLARPGG